MQAREKVWTGRRGSMDRQKGCPPSPAMLPPRKGGNGRFGIKNVEKTGAGFGDYKKSLTFVHLLVR